MEEYSNLLSEKKNQDSVFSMLLIVNQQPQNMCTYISGRLIKKLLDCEIVSGEAKGVP